MGEAIERACAHPLAFWVFTVLFAIGCTWNIDVTNIAISYFTCALLLLTLGAQRRSGLAMHTKLDDLECAVEQADDTNKRLEERTEQEIEEKRHD